MLERFIPELFTKQGIEVSDVADQVCEDFLLSEYNFSSTPKEDISELASSEWNSRNFYSITSWADWYWRLDNKDFVEYVKEKLEDQVLIDLGGGKSVMSNFAFLFKAKAYVNVDMGSLLKDDSSNLDHKKVAEFMSEAWKGSLALDKISTHHIQIDSQHECKQYKLKMDMLDFLSRIPDDFMPIITMNGIDNCIIHSSEYAVELNKEIRRVLKPNGVLLASKSWVIDMNSIGEEECLDYPMDNFGFKSQFVFEKNSK